MNFVATSLTGLYVLLIINCADGAATACCALKLMDANQQIAIETTRVLPVGQFRAASVRVCATDTVIIQLWTRLDSSSLQLKWQTSFSPTTAQTNQASVAVVFDIGNLPTVTADDRLGLFGIVSSSGVRKLDIPYDADQINGGVRMSVARFLDTSTFRVGLQVAVEDISWPRSFASYVRFCTSADCSDVAFDPADISTTPYAPYSSTTATSLPFCGCPMSCSPDVSMRDSLSQQETSISVLQDQLNKMTSLIDGMQSSNVPTGYCPESSVPGVYGIGSCYIIYRENVQLGEAVIRCATDHGANLLDIESSVEQQFIYSIVTSNGTSTRGNETFWTAGMYSEEAQMWMWYMKDWSTGTPIAANSYRAWLNNFEPRPQSHLDNCLVVTVDSANENSYWMNSLCIANNYFICEIPKACF